MRVLKLGQSLVSNTKIASGFDNKFSLTYDGVDDYLSLGDDVPPLTPFRIEGSDGWSFSIWLKTGTSKKIFSKNIGGAAEYDFVVRFNGNPKLVLYDQNNGGNISYNMNTSIADGNWHHIVFTWNGETEAGITAYFDGGVKGGTDGASGLFESVVATPAEFRMAYGGGSYSAIIQDEFSVFNKVLTSTEVSTLYNSGVPTDVTEISGCQGWWRNGDPTGTGAFPTISDDSSNSNDGTMTNMASNDIITDVP
tara:strand:- start:42 stop:794 length:753 start_codon:yes stop_codon:yes gene_type:complete